MDHSIGFFAAALLRPCIGNTGKQAVQRYFARSRALPRRAALRRRSLQKLREELTQNAPGFG